MQKFLMPTLIILILIAGGGGYYLGLKRGTTQGTNEGRTALQKELQDKEEAYKKSKDAVRDVAEKYLRAFKFGDFRELYAAICPGSKLKEKLSEEEFIKQSEERTKDSNYITQDFTMDDVVVNKDVAKVRFTEIRIGIISSKELKIPAQFPFKFIKSEWCFDSDNL